MNFYHNTRCTTPILSGVAPTTGSCSTKKYHYFAMIGKLASLHKTGDGIVRQIKIGDNVLRLAGLVSNVSTIATCSGAYGEGTDL